jgi:hypothetical protein
MPVTKGLPAAAAKYSATRAKISFPSAANNERSRLRKPLKALKLPAQFKKLNPAAITRSMAALQARLGKKALHRQPWSDRQQRAVTAATG